MDLDSCREKRYLAYVCGDRSTQAGTKLWEKVKDAPYAYYPIDYWKNDAEFIPLGEHIQNRAETYTVEGYNSSIRHYLTRFRRRENVIPRLLI